MNIEILNDQDTESFDALVSGVRQHNHLKLGNEETQPLSVIARNESNEVIAGVSGVTIYKHFLVNVVWVAETAREQGLGKKLMLMAESEAKQRGCIAAQVDTLSIQAPDFYQKLGFKIAGKIPGLTQDHDRYFLMKLYDQCREQV